MSCNLWELDEMPKWRKMLVFNLQLFILSCTHTLDQEIWFCVLLNLIIVAVGFKQNLLKSLSATYYNGVKH